METKEKKQEDKNTEKEKENKKEIKKTNKKLFCCKSENFPLGFSFGFFTMGLLSVLLISFLFVPLFKNKVSRENVVAISDAKTTVENFVNDILLAGKDTITIEDNATEESGLYKISFKTSDGRNFNSYLTKDGKLFFTQVLDIEKMTKEAENKNKEVENKEIIKNDKPVVELFVMSYCPYGTQIEKGFLPVISNLGDKIDFQVKFVNYVMHGKKEIDENINQYCIQKQENEKYMDYLRCFLEDGDGSGCIKKTKINSTKLSSCVSSTDEEFSITKKFNNKEAWTSGSYPPFNIHGEENIKYGVKGSPTLVINGTKVSSARDPKSILDIICSAFKTVPEECSSDLPSVSAAPGFGFDKEGNATEASCG